MQAAKATNFLDTAIEYLKGVGSQRAELLNKELGIFTVRDLLVHYPFRYVDRTKFYQIREVRPNSAEVQVKGVITQVATIGRQRGKRMVATLRDESGTMELVWFKGLQWIGKIVKRGTPLIVFGKPTLFNGKLQMTHPELEVAGSPQAEANVAGLHPVYSSTEKLKTKGLDSRGLERIITNALARLTRNELPENLSRAIREQHRLIARFEAMRIIHRPAGMAELRQAQARLKFEELFFIQLRVLKHKVNRTAAAKGFVFEKIDHCFDLFYKNNLPFELTGAQKRVLREIRKNVLSGRQMNRLLQGDVGSGKTIVALMVMLMALDNGFQACLMAPTEILAQQHFTNIRKMVKGLGIRVALLTGNVKGRQRKALLKLLQAGELHLLIGTHALIENAVAYHNLGCVIIDEQHRFGVAQRARLWMKNEHPPHVLVMTATPIPRTLAMTVYGDLDVSVIDELPPGRKPVQTIHRYDQSRLKVFRFLKEQIEAGRQVYIVYPLIQESEKMDYKDLMDGYESIQRAFPEYETSIVHGQMKPDDKDFEMQRFVEGKTQLMVATTVIEVGVDVPNASVMVIESAERFGLSQLHQLRGRVGRGADQSYCLLMTGHKLSNEARQRLSTMTGTNDGFKIAEVDLKLRGPGDIEGTQQSGLLDLRIANVIADEHVLKQARQTARQVLQADPTLSAQDNLPLRLHLQQLLKGRPDWSRVS